MYRNILVPIDCSPDMRHTAPEIAAFLSPRDLCQVTLVAVTSPSDTDEQKQNKISHAREALQTIADILLQSGIYSRRRLVQEVENGDLATAVTAECRRSRGEYDLILLGSYHTRQEEFDQPCIGSTADRICAHATLPVLVLPTQRTVTP